MEFGQQLQHNLQVRHVQAVCLLHDGETLQPQVVHDDDSGLFTGVVAGGAAHAVPLANLIQGGLELRVELHLCPEQESLKKRS